MLDIFLPHLLREIFGGSHCEREDRKRWILGAARNERAAIYNEQVLYVVRLIEVV